MPQAEISDLVESLWQNVLEEAAHELLAGQLALTRPPFLSILVAEGDGLLIHGEYAVIVDGNPKGVSGQVFKNSLFAFSPMDAVDHPLLFPGILGPQDVWTGVFQRHQGFSTYEAAQCLDRDEKLLFCRMPRISIIGDSSSGNQTVNMGVKNELLGPGVQDHEDTDSAADVFGVSGQFNGCLPGGFHEDVVAVGLIGPENIAQGFRYRDGQMEIGGRQHF